MQVLDTLKKVPSVLKVLKEVKEVEIELGNRVSAPYPDKQSRNVNQAKQNGVYFFGCFWDFFYEYNKDNKYLVLTMEDFKNIRYMVLHYHNFFYWLCIWGNERENVETKEKITSFVVKVIELAETSFITNPSDDLPMVKKEFLEKVVNNISQKFPLFTKYSTVIRELNVMISDIYDSKMEKFILRKTSTLQKGDKVSIKNLTGYQSNFNNKVMEVKSMSIYKKFDKIIRSVVSENIEVLKKLAEYDKKKKDK
jgi:hypothetical protein